MSLLNRGRKLFYLAGVVLLGYWCWFEIICDNPLFMNAIAKNNSERCLFIRDENYFKGLGVTLLGCHVRVFAVRYLLQGSLREYSCRLSIQDNHQL